MEEYILSKMQEAHRILRHDFMNALQVIYGFHQLEQPEKCKAYTMKTIESMKKFIPLGKIGLPLLQSVITVFFTIHNSNQGACTVDVEPDKGAWDLEDDRKLTRLTINIMCLLEPYIADGLLRCRIVLSPGPRELITVILEGVPEVLAVLKSRLAGKENPSPFNLRIQDDPEVFRIIIGKKAVD